MSLLLVWRHRANIRKLLAGTESKFGRKKPLAEATKTSKPSKPHKARTHP